METAVFILLIVSLVTLFLTTTALIICLVPNNKAYCYLFEHKNWKLWESVCKALPNAIFVKHYISEDRPDLDSYNFYVCIDEVGLPIEIVYWENTGKTSVHTKNGVCLLSSFDKYHSNKARQILKPMLLNK